MNFTCLICTDFVMPSAEIYATQCGHLFHCACLLQWLEKSKTCPQCRCKTSEQSLHRIYFNLTEKENLKDAGVLRNKLDDLQRQLHLKDEKIDALQEKLKTNSSVQHKLQVKLNFFRSQVKENQRLTEENARLKNKLKDAEAVQLAINGSKREVDDILKIENNIESLAIVAATLKSALLDSEEKKNNYEHETKQLHNEVLTLNRQIVDSEEEKMYYEFKNKQLLNEISKLQRRIFNLKTKYVL